MENFDVLIPRPQKIETAPGVLKVEGLGTVSAPENWERFSTGLIRNAAFMGLDLAQEGTPVQMVFSADIKVESFEITITPDAVGGEGR